VLLYPAIDLRGGRCVRLHRGDYAHETVYADDPVAIARDFAEQGARWIHVVDLDAARDGSDANLETVEAICAAVPACRVQTGGGVRSVEAAGARLAAGAARVVVGSAAVSDPALVTDLAVAHPGRVAVGLDVRGREVAVQGWTVGTGVSLFEVVSHFAASGASALVVTQIDVDGTMLGPDLELYRELLEATPLPVIASGGIATLDDLRSLAGLAGHDGSRLAGAIAGRAVYERRFTVAEGVAACSA
jgi:phosphoribosylformimino-5-aminoimidazole carboxamide ribotide isomerase